MKKITLLAALLGSAYFANAQVGIGTPTPSNASQLDIVASNKGVLIPRVALETTTKFSPIAGDETESLLVYNTATSTGADAVSPGFYYWVDQAGTTPAHWERIVNQTQLDQAISNITDLQGDVDKILALLKAAFPSNNLVDPANTGDSHGGGMVFTPGTTPTIEYVYFDGTNYVKKDITSDIIDIINGAESKTLLIKTTDGTKQYYISETYLTANNGVAPTQSTVDGWTTLPVGVYQVDIIGGVINNIEEIFTTNTTIVVNEGETNEQTFNTIEEYIQYISSQADGNVIYKNTGTAAAPNWVFQYWDAAANGGDGEYVTINLTDLVGNAQSKTSIVKTTDGKNQYYISEVYLTANNNTNPSQTVINGWASATTLPAGIFEIDIVGGVVNNFNEIINEEVTVNGDTYTTVEEYIEYVSQNAMQNGVTKIIYHATTGDVIFQTWNSTTGTWENVDNAKFATIVKTNETRTTLTRSQNNGAYAEVTADPKGATVVAYEYTPEKGAKNYINVTADILYSITNNQNIRNAITNILNEGGNVYYGDHDNDTATPDVFYTIVNNVKTPIDISDIVINAIVNATTEQKQMVKNELGDVYSETNVVNTGDTWIDGGKIYKGIYSATVTGGSANVSAITITSPSGTTLGNIISIKVLNAATNQIINSSTTDVDLSGNSLSFKIGTGSMYNVLSTADLSVKVIVEFSATE